MKSTAKDDRIIITVNDRDEYKNALDILKKQWHGESVIIFSYKDGDEKFTRKTFIDSGKIIAQSLHRKEFWWYDSIEVEFKDKKLPPMSAWKRRHAETDHEYGGDIGYGGNIYYVAVKWLIENLDSEKVEGIKRARAKGKDDLEDYIWDLYRNRIAVKLKAAVGKLFPKRKLMRQLPSRKMVAGR
jgi:hypothetical protein